MLNQLEEIDLSGQRSIPLLLLATCPTLLSCKTCLIWFINRTVKMSSVTPMMIVCGTYVITVCLSFSSRLVVNGSRTGTPLNEIEKEKVGDDEVE